jgi:hypothetical protein
LIYNTAEFPVSIFSLSIYEIRIGCPSLFSEIKANISQYETDGEEEEIEETEPNMRSKKRLNPYRFFQAWTN